MNGPLDVLKNTWEAGGPGEESVVSHILSISDKLAKMTELVKNAQERQHKWYDHNAHTREFKPGQQVLMLLPTSCSKVLAQWQGPYEIVKRMGEVNYIVDMCDRSKRKWLFHINMLREWYTPSSSALYSTEVLDGEQDIPTWTKSGKTQSKVQPIFGNNLTQLQQREPDAVVREI